MPDILRTRFAGELWTASQEARDKHGLYWIHLERGAGFHKDPNTINGGGNSGFQAVHLAATFGAKRIVLLGFDMQRTDGKLHWHGKHWGGLPNGRGFPSWIRQFKPLAVDLDRMGVDVVNASRATALRWFRQMTPEDAAHGF